MYSYTYIFYISNYYIIFNVIGAQKISDSTFVQLSPTHRKMFSPVWAPLKMKRQNTSFQKGYHRKGYPVNSFHRNQRYSLLLWAP